MWTWGVFVLTPAVAMLINRTHILFVALFSFLLFKDERKVIKSRRFLLGSLLAAIGVAGVIAGRNDLEITGSNFNQGVILILIGAILWSAYIIIIKKMVRQTEPLVAVGIIYTLSIPLFFVCSFIWGDLAKIFNVPLRINILLFISGIFCVGVANAFNYKSVKLIGAAISSTFVSASPFFTAVASYFIFKEMLTIQQIFFGVMLIAGCAILLKGTNRFVPET